MAAQRPLDHSLADPMATAPTCRIVGGFSAVPPDALDPLLRHLERDEPVAARVDFPVGTLLPDGRLDLCKQDLGPEGAKAVAASLRGNHQVAHLLLGANGIGDEGANAVAALARENETVRTVYLGCNQIGPEGAEALADAFAANPNVRALWLKRNPIGDEGAQALAARLRKSNGLRVLDLTSSLLGRDGLRLLAEALADVEVRIERLYLCGNRLGAGDIGPIVSLVPSTRAPEHLYLSVNRLGDAGARLLARALGENRTLSTLSLSSNGLGPEAAWPLAQAVGDHPRLQVLELGYEPSTAVLGEQGNRLGDEGAAALAEVLRRNRVLSGLDLLRNGITDEGARVLLDALRLNDRVTDLAFGKGLAPELRRDLKLLLDRNRADAPPRPPTGTDGDVAAIRSVYRIKA